MAGLGPNPCLEPRSSSPRFYLAAMEKIGCEIKSGRGRPGFAAIQIVGQ